MSIKSRFEKHLIVQILSLIILLLLLFLTIIPSVKKIQTEVLGNKKDLLNDIERSTGLKLSYERMSPLILDSIELYNAKIDGENGLSSAAVSKVVLKINILSILFSDKTSTAPVLLESVTLIDGYLTLHHHDLHFIEKMTTGGYSTELFQTKIIAKKMDFNLNLGNMEFNFDDIKGSFKNKLSRYYLDIRSGLSFQSRMDLPFSWIDGELNFKGYLSQNFRNITSEITYKNITSDIGRLKDLHFDGEFDSGDFKFSNLITNDQYDYLIKYSMGLNEFFFSCDLGNFRIDDLFIPNKTFELFDQFLDSSLTGEIKGVYNFNEQTFLYNFLGRIKLINTSLPLPLTMDVHTVGDLDEITLYYLNSSTSLGSFRFNGVVDLKTFFPQGNLYVKNYKVSENIKINSSIDINVLNSNFISANFDFIESGNFRVTDIPSLIYVDENDVSFQALKKDEKGKISLSGNYSRLDGVISSILNVDSWKTTVFKELIPDGMVSEILDDSYLDMHGSISFNSKSFNFNLKKLELTDSNNKSLLNLNGRGSNRGFNIDQLAINTENINLIGRLDADIEDDIIDIHLDSLFNENKYNFNIKIDDENINITGSYGFNMSLILGETKYINIAANDFPVNYRGFSLNPTFKLKGILFKDNNFLLSMPQFSTRIKHDYYSTPPYLSFSMDGSDEDISIYDIIYDDGNSPLNGTMSLVNESDGLFNISALLDGNNAELYSIKSEISRADKKAKLDIYINNSNLKRFQVQGLRGIGACKLNLDGSIDDYSLKGSITSDNFDYKTKKGSGAINISANEGLFSISDSSITYGSNSYSIPLITYNLNAGQILGQVDTQFDISNFQLRNNMTLDFVISPEDSVFEINNDTFNKINGKLTIGEMYSNDKLLFSNKVIRIFNNRSALQVYSVDDQLKLLYSHRTGLLNFKVNKPYFAEMTANGWLKNDKLDIQVRNLNVDAELLEIYIPFTPEKKSQIADFDKLDIRGQLHLQGDVENPVMNGLLWVDSEINAAYIPKDIKPVRLYVRVDNNMVTFLPGKIYIGDNGQINLKGEFPIESWRPEYILIETEIIEENKIPVRYQYNRIVGETNIYTDGLKILWQPSGTIVNGNVTISDGEFYTEEALEVEDSPSKINGDSDYVIDLLVRSGQNNKLFLPNKNFPIVEAIAKPGDEVKVDYRSVDQSFRVLGKVSIMQGKVEYSGKPFILKKGEVTLNLSPEDIDPYIFIEGSNTVFDENDQQVEVILTYEGGFYSDFKPTFSSDPIKSEEEILRLIGVAVVGDDWQDLVSSADLITSAFVSKPLEDAIQKILGVDYVKIKSGFLSSIITNISFEQESDLEYNDQDNLSRILNDTSLSIGNFVTKDFFVRGSVGTTYGDNKLGMEVDFDLTLYSPHFQLGFSMKPRITETSFTPEFGLTLGWVYSPEN